MAATTAEQPQNYSRVAQALHWGSMILILGIAVGGFVMTNIMEDSATRNTLYRMHVAGGNLILLLTIARVVMIFVEKRPALPEGVTGFKRVLFEGNHYALYVVLLLLAFSGSAMLILSGLTPATMSSLTPDMIQDVAPRQGHDLFSKLFMLLFVAHVVGVLRYQFVDGDVMGRMGVPFPGRKA
jgi:cytochrome b561